MDRLIQSVHICEDACTHWHRTASGEYSFLVHCNLLSPVVQDISELLSELAQTIQLCTQGRREAGKGGDIRLVFRAESVEKTLLPTCTYNCCPRQTHCPCHDSVYAISCSPCASIITETACVNLGRWTKTLCLHVRTEAVHRKLTCLRVSVSCERRTESGNGCVAPGISLMVGRDSRYGWLGLGLDPGQ